MIGAEDVMEIKGSPRKLIGILLLGLLMTAGSAALAFHWLPESRPGRHGESVAWGWVGLLFFGLATTHVLWLLRTVGRTVITITSNGIKDERLAAGFIPWSAIQSLSTRQIRGQKFIVLAVTPSIEKRLGLALLTRLMLRPSRMLGFNGLHISSVGIKIDHDALFRECSARWQAAQK